MIRLLTAVLICLVCMAASQPSRAHELRPAYLEIRESAGNIFDFVWKVPARGDRRLALSVRLPPVCESGNPTASKIDNAIIKRWRAVCAGGLSGRELAVDGLSRTLTDVLVRLERLDGTMQAARLTPDKPGFTVDTAQGYLGVTTTYFLLGVEHILAGVDHLLFVLALLLIVSGWRRLLVTITSFTIAHSITLAAATLGFLWVPGPPVEAVIALSIMFLASELIRIDHGEESLTARFPWVIAFTFGLLHGLGFAGALSEIGLPQTDIPLALLVFNVGVEAGQIIFVAVALAAIWTLKRAGLEWPGWARQAPAYGIGTISAFWFVERIAGFW